MDDAALLVRLRAVMEGAMRLAQSMQPTRSERKAHQDHVTDVDMALDAHLQQELAALVPEAPVLSEERAVGIAGACKTYWIVDPIDGTANLIAGLPFVGIAVALVDADGPRLAAVAALGEGTIYLAQRGGGSLRVGAEGTITALRLAPAAPELLVLSTGLLDRLMAEGGTRWTQLRAVGKIRNLGAQSLHLCGVADGRFAAVASIEARVWDEAAGGLILREAGGFWRSSVDMADWTQPRAIMDIRQQRSLACHPTVEAALTLALEGILAGTKGDGILGAATE